MNSQNSITHLITQLKGGEEAAAHDLWDRYFRKLTDLAKRRLKAHPRRAADEEDVVISVFDSLCDGAARGRFDQLTDRQDLWRLLLAITRQKAVDVIRRENRKKRGGGAVRGESIFDSDVDAPNSIEELISAAPTPDLLVMIEEQHEQLLAKLRSDDLRLIANRKLEGYSNREIAEELGVVERTIRRKVNLIMDEWAAVDGQHGAENSA